MSFISSYTFSKSIDTTSGIRVQGYDQLYPQNSFCLNPCERGFSSFDVRHRFVTSLVYDLPAGKGHRVDGKNMLVNSVIGGWQIASVWTVQSGLPGTINLGGVDRTNTAVNDDRPDVVNGVSTTVSNPSPSRWFNPAAFVEQPAGQFGNVGRNNVTGPGVLALDFSAHKEFRMPYSEYHLLQFRFEAFNVMNHPAWGMPQLNILSGTAFSGQPTTNPHQGFGVITGTAVAMRQIQLGLKYSF